MGGDDDDYGDEDEHYNEDEYYDEEGAGTVKPKVKGGRV
jgi:hypothetical protein